MTTTLIDKLVNKFLGWPLPASVAADPCASIHGAPNRSGTNLLTAAEARQMLEYVLGEAIHRNAETAEEAEVERARSEVPVLMDDKENKMTELTTNERKQIAEILDRRANEIAGFSVDYMNDSHPFGSVELALSREIERLRRLADRVNPSDPDEEL